MTKNDRTAAKKRSAMLVNLRKEHREGVKAAQALMKEQQTVRKALRRALQGEPKTVPQLAESIDLPPHEVLWHIAALKKYGQVREVGLDDEWEYYQYALAEEAKS
jgi:hypothetical protein